MEKEQKKVQTEKLKRVKRKKHALHYLLVYLGCLLAAFVIWLSVRYSMRLENTAPHTDDCEATMSVFASFNEEESLYV